MLNQPIGADFTVPAGTLPAAPAVFTLPTLGNWITQLRLTVPRGHNGVTGWRLLLSGSVIVPYFGGGWVIASDEVFTFQVNRWAETGQLVMQAYNQGTFNHTFHVVADAYPTEPVPPVQAVLAGTTAADAATIAAVGALAAEPGTAAAADGQGDTAAAPGLDTDGLEPDGTEPVVDVTTFSPAPTAGGLTPLEPANPVDRTGYGGHRAALRRPEPPASTRGGRAPAPIRERPPVKRTPPRAARPKPAPEPKPKGKR